MREEIGKLFPKEVRNLLEKAELKQEYLQEIRLRINGPLLVVYRGEEYFLGAKGGLCKDPGQAFRVCRRCLQETLEYLSGYSLYAYEEEVRQGYLTLQGGHRVGLAGKTILDGEKITSIRFISFINIRFSHQVKGCASVILPYIAQGSTVRHTPADFTAALRKNHDPAGSDPADIRRR